MDVAFRYGAQPTEAQTRAMARVRDVYGIWRMNLDAKERTLRVEYDASRLSEHVVASLLRSAAFAEARSPRNNYAKWKRAKQLDNSTA
jgi:hypothetical protein